MRYSVVAISLAAFGAAAAAQEAAPGAVPVAAPASPWQFFEEAGGRNGALVKAADGTQLVLKCDKPGRREVHAILMSPSEKLGQPVARPVSRPIWFQFDQRPPKTEEWGFFEHHAIAQGKTSDRALARFVIGLRESSKVRMRLDTGIGADVEMQFDVTGADQAIARVYQACNDSAPT